MSINVEKAIGTVLNLSKLKKITATATNRLKCFAIFKNVSHSLEPGETPSHSASHQASNYVQRSSISQTISNGLLRLRFGCGYFFNLLKFSTKWKGYWKQYFNVHQFYWKNVLHRLWLNYDGQRINPCIYSRISISQTRIIRILRSLKRLSELKMHFDCFLQP